MGDDIDPNLFNFDTGGIGVCRNANPHEKTALRGVTVYQIVHAVFHRCVAGLFGVDRAAELVVRSGWFSRGNLSEMGTRTFALRAPVRETVVFIQIRTTIGPAKKLCFPQNVNVGRRSFRGSGVEKRSD